MIIKNSSIDALNRHSLINNNLKHAYKHSNIVSLNNKKQDAVTLSKQAEFKQKQLNLNKTNETVADIRDEALEKAFMISVTTKLVDATLDNAKTEIEDNIKAYSSYISKIDDGTLDKDISFDEYAETEIKKKHQQNSILLIKNMENKTNDSEKIEEIEHVESTEGKNIRKSQALEQLEKRIKKIVDDTVKNLNHIFDGISTSSKELSDKLDQIKKNVKILTNNLGAINLNDTQSKIEFANSLKQIFKSINTTQNILRSNMYNDLKDIYSHDKEYMSFLTNKYENETSNNLARYNCDINLIDNVFFSDKNLDLK